MVHTGAAYVVQGRLLFAGGLNEVHREKGRAMVDFTLLVTCLISLMLILLATQIQIASVNREILEIRTVLKRLAAEIEESRKKPRSR
jgi:hypothetical protein